MQYPTATSIENVKRLRVAVQTRSLPADLADWLGRGLESWLAGDATSLCRALGLRGPGRRGSAATDMALTARDAALAAAAVAVLPAGTDRQRAAALAPIVRRFQTDVWPRVMGLEQPPTRFTEAQIQIWLAFRARTPPRSAGAILAAIRKAQGLSSRAAVDDCAHAQ